MNTGTAHLTYCTNVHPGESLRDVVRNVETCVVRVKNMVAPDQPFGVGLRLSATAAHELAEPDAVRALRDVLATHQLYVFTINGFPYGRFHGAPVKEEVYRPDWLEPERLAYTNQLADVLAALLPEGVSGSISTVPGCFRSRVHAGAVAQIGANLRAHASYLRTLEHRTGKRIVLAVEPEPCCLMETIEQVADLFALEIPAEDRRYVGICIDACHAAVEYEVVDTALERLRAADITIAKVQLSTGLVVDPRRHEQRDALGRFDDGVYLHQVVARSGTVLRRHDDLAEALASTDPDDEWRVHVHVPIF